MSYHLEAKRPSGFDLVLEGEPSNCHALTMAPRDREPELNQGFWFILVFAVWSGPDRNAIEQATTLAREFGEKLNVGIRPFDQKEELKAWCPDATIQWVSPVWLILKRGALVTERFGPQPTEKLREAIAEELG